MNSDRFRQIERIYHAALEIPADKQGLFLDDECGTDTELRKEVDALLFFEENPVEFINAGPRELVAEIFAAGETAKDFAGKKIDRYEIRKILGEGGMGTVYLAQDTRLARLVALKVLPAEMVESNDRVQRFVHEARSASALNHPHILTIHEIDQVTCENGETIHYISMEFVDGPTFEKLIYSNGTSARDLLKYLSQVARGLAKAHSAGIIHRDLKPDNIIVSTDGYAKILDFGLAKLTDLEHELHALQLHRSRSGVILGTLGYMSPEQAQGKSDIDEASDIFALGCILYEAVTKRKAFAAETTVDALHQIIYSEPTPVRALYPGISDELDDLISQCLKKDPRERLRNSNQIAGILQRLSTENTDPGFPNAISGQVQPVKKATGRDSISGQRRQVTVMFTDVSAISEMIENADPERSAQIMKGVSDLLVDLIEKGGGKVAEQLADTALSIWGTALISESDPENCVRTALHLQTAVSDHFNKALSREIFPHDDEIKPTQFLKISVSTGTVLVGNSSDTGEFMTAGSAVNGAKRLLSHVPGGEVLVSHDTYRHIRGVFQIEEVQVPGGDTLKRTKQPRVYRVRGVKPRAFRLETRGVEGIETLLVGRETELKKILDVLDAVREDKQLQVVTIVGEAGLGKSRLLFEFQDKVELSPDLFYVFNARAPETMRGVPFSLVRDLFLFRFEIQENDSKHAANEKFVAGMLAMTRDAADKFGQGEKAEMKAHFIGQLIGLDFSESPYLSQVTDDQKQIQDRARLYASQFFSAVAQRAPAVIYLDDLHWADDESLNFFDLISRECAGDAIMIAEFTRPILFERRPHWREGQEDRIRLNLQPLTKRESSELIGSILQKAEIIPDELRSVLLSNTEGNPFYVEELIKMFIEQGAINAAREKWKIDTTRLGEIMVPPTLIGVLQSRLDKLSVSEKQVLQRASVVGREFWDDALGDFDAAIDVPSILDSLRRKELLFRKEISVFDNANEYLFKHTLLRDVTYETVLLDDRRAWHLETAEWLVRTKRDRRSEYLAVIAEHFEKAGEIERSAYWYGSAGEQAHQSYALHLAEHYLLRALKYWGDVTPGDASGILKSDRVMEWQYTLGRVLFQGACFAEATRVFSESLAMAKRLNNKFAQAYAHWGLSFTEFEAGETRKSLESARQMAVLMDDDDLPPSKERSVLMIRSLYRQGRALVSLGEFEQAISLTEKIIDLIARSGETVSDAKTKSLHLLSVANRCLGRFKPAGEFCLREIESARDTGDLRTVCDGLNSLGFQLYSQGNGTEAIASYEEALDIANEIGHRNGAIMIRSNIGGAKVYLEEYEAAEHELKTLIAEVGDRGHFLVTEMYRFLTEALIGQDKFDEALKTARKSLALSIETENQETTGEAWRVLSILSSCLKGTIVIDDEPYSATDCFEKGMAIFKDLGMEAYYAQALHNYAQHRSATGDATGAKELFDIENEISTRLDIDTTAKCVYVKA